MKKLSKVAVFALTALTSVALASPAQACTGVIVGGDLTSDGSTIFGRTEDLEQNHPKHMEVHPAAQFAKGSQIADSDTSAKWTQQQDSLQYTSISDDQGPVGDYRFDEAGYNSAGVAIDATVSASANDQVLTVDPYGGDADPATGWEESTLTTVLLANAHSAREAVDLMATMVKNDGMAEGDILVAADQKELWYMELYTGHQYAAMKYPRDKYSVFPNAFWLNYVDCTDTANYVCSADLEKVAKDAGTYKETDGHFDPALSYNPPNEQTDRNGSRVWSGLKVLDPGNPAQVDQAQYPLLNTPSSSFTKVDVARVMDLQRNRFQGLQPDSYAAASQKVADDGVMTDASGKKVEGALYPIGNTNTMEAHIFQMPASGMPAAVPGTLWMAVGSPQSSPYLPFYGNIQSVAAPLASGKATAGVKGQRPKHPYADDASSFYWMATGLGHAVERDRATLEKPTLDCLRAYEKTLIDQRGADNAKLAQLYSQDPDAAAKWATDSYAKTATTAFAGISAMKAKPGSCALSPKNVTDEGDNGSSGSDGSTASNGSKTPTSVAGPGHSTHHDAGVPHQNPAMTGSTAGKVGLIALIVAAVGLGIVLVRRRRN